MIGRTVLRVAVGGVMVGHGLQKLKGSFGGPGLEGTEKMMTAIEMHPAKYQARAVALSETIGGALTALGFLSPIGPAMISGVHLTAIKKVHLKNGVWVTGGGYEYNAVLLAAAFAIAAEGPGALSFDALFRKHRSGLHWGLLELALAAGAAFGNIELAKRLAPAGSGDGGHGDTSTSGPSAGESGAAEEAATS